MVNIPYHLARLIGKISRLSYKSNLYRIVHQPLLQNQKIPVSVYSLSCERDLPEQIASISSFIKYVGIPESFIVASDGSYSIHSCKLLEQLHNCVSVVPINQLIREDLPSTVHKYAAQHCMGKKLALLLSLPNSHPTIYTDSDILFFPGANDLLSIISSGDSTSYYLPDCTNKFDSRIIYDPLEIRDPINAGFIIFKSTLDWGFALERLSKLNDSYDYFTEQTIVHLTLHHNQSRPLDPNLYVLRVEDQFVFNDQFANKKIALRHYVNDIRYKFWFNTRFQQL